MKRLSLSQVDSATLDTVTRERWRKAGFKQNSAQLPQILGQRCMNPFPKNISRKGPFNTKGLDTVLSQFG